VKNWATEEKQIAKDLMFRRFIYLSLSESVPDHSTIWRFRQFLNTENLLEALLEQINHHLEQNRIIVSLGSINIIDVSFIEAKHLRRGLLMQSGQIQQQSLLVRLETLKQHWRQSERVSMVIEY
jgi:IS5 family transposase